MTVTPPKTKFDRGNEKEVSKPNKTFVDINNTDI